MSLRFFSGDDVVDENAPFVVVALRDGLLLLLVPKRAFDFVGEDVPLVRKGLADRLGLLWCGGGGSSTPPFWWFRTAGLRLRRTGEAAGDRDAARLLPTAPPLALFFWRRTGLVVVAGRPAPRPRRRLLRAAASFVAVVRSGLAEVVAGTVPTTVVVFLTVTPEDDDDCCCCCFSCNLRLCLCGTILLVSTISSSS